jgi:hypothetical protein
VLNLFAFRAIDPADLKRAEQPVGPENREWFGRTLAGLGDGPVICGWGVHCVHLGQDLVVLGRLEDIGIRPLVLGETKDGHPRHPLYLPNSAELITFVGRKP